MSQKTFSTAGAVAVKNEKGETILEKVKVQRYVSGRKPKYADEHSSDESDEDGFVRPEPMKKLTLSDNLQNEEYFQEANVDEKIEIIEPEYDRRLQRLQKRREIAEPEVIEEGENREARHRRRHREYDSSDEEESKEDEDENVERRHAILRQKLLNEEEVLKVESEEDESEDEEEDEEESSSEEEAISSEDETGPRLKPVFVRKQDRISLIKQREEEEKREKEEEEEARKLAEERRSTALKLIEDSVQREEKEKDEDIQITFESIAAVNTDDESEEVAYLNWKVRELKRNKRDKEEREAIIKQREEVERLRNMTEEERLLELKKNPKIIVNQSEKGKYRFMQKYYHRGAFFMDEESNVLKRDFAAPTLEDHFDKAVLPKVMQVKKFGMAGQTKYTHLVDQDTTKFDSPWNKDSSVTSKFYQKHAAGMKQEFERPSKKRRN